MGDKIVKSKNLCCQLVVFPSLSLLNKFFWSNQCYFSLKKSKYSDAFIDSYKVRMGKMGKLEVSNRNLSLILLNLREKPCTYISKWYKSKDTNFYFCCMYFWIQIIEDCLDPLVSTPILFNFIWNCGLVVFSIENKVSRVHTRKILCIR